MSCRFVSLLIMIRFIWTKDVGVRTITKFKKGFEETYVNLYHMDD